MRRSVAPSAPPERRPFGARALERHPEAEKGESGGGSEEGPRRVHPSTQLPAFGAGISTQHLLEERIKPN